MNKKLSVFTIVGIIFTIALGCLGHFLYEWSGNNYIVGFFFAINESVWEHIKLALLPMFIYFAIGLFALPKKKNYASAVFLALLSVIITIPAMHYGYMFFTGKSIIWLDISIFFISIIIGYLIAYGMMTSKSNARILNFVSFIGIIIVIICFATFSYNPPEWIIFQDPSK